MTIQDAQKMVDQWIKSTGKGYFSVLTNLGILTEEVGEVARIIVRTHGDQNSKKEEQPFNNDHLADELSDVLWIVLCLANQNSIDMQQAMADNLQKKIDRDNGRHNA